MERNRADKNRNVVTHDNDDGDGNHQSEEMDLVNKANQDPKLLSSIYNYLVVLSIILIVFAAFRNSVTW